MKNYRDFLDNNWIVNLILTIFFGNLTNGLYRIFGTQTVSKVVGAIQLALFVLAVVFSRSIWILSIAIFALQIIDIVSIATKHKITLFAD